MDPLHTYLLVLAGYFILYLLASFVYRYYFPDHSSGGHGLREPSVDRTRPSE